MPEKLENALAALRFIIPILERYNFRWVITGGFTCYIYGVERPITDIDIDIDASKNTPQFKKFLKELEPHITQPLERMSIFTTSPFPFSRKNSSSKTKRCS